MTTSSTASLCLGCGYVLDGLERPRCPECGRPFDSDDPATFGRPDERAYRAVLGFLRAARRVTVPATAAWVWWTTMRTLTFGPGEGVLFHAVVAVVAASLCGVFPAVVAWLGLPFRRAWWAVTLTVYVPACVAVAVIEIEEQQFVAHCRTLPQGGNDVVKTRWWPNNDEKIFHSYGRVGGCD